MFGNPKDNAVTNLQDVPEYRDAYDRMMELRGERDALDRKIADVQGRINDAVTGLRDAVDDAARALLVGTDPAEAADDRRTIRELHERRAIVSRAAKMQEEIMGALSARLSREIATAHRPTYQALVTEIAQKLNELCELRRREVAFRNKLADGGVSFSGIIPPMGLPAWLDDREHSSGVNYWRRDARQHYGVK